MTAETASALAAGTHFTAHPSCCPAFPKAISATQRHDLTFDTAALLFAEVLSHPASQQQTEARARVALDRSRHKRGPPSARLS
jgi:hypothetical protein